MAVNAEQNTVILFLEFYRQTLLGPYCRDCGPVSSHFRTSKCGGVRMSPPTALEISFCISGIRRRMISFIELRRC